MLDFELVLGHLYVVKTFELAGQFPKRVMGFDSEIASTKRFEWNLSRTDCKVPSAAIPNEPPFVTRHVIYS